MRNMERKRAQDRARMARLYDQGKTWWQLHPDRRLDYDFLDMRPYLDARPLYGHPWRKRPALSTEEIRSLATENIVAVHRERLARIEEDA